MFTFAGVLLAMFLGALDQTIVSTALPRIVTDLHGFDRFTWVATAYLVASTALVPIYGKLADTYSRRAIEGAAVSILHGHFAGEPGQYLPGHGRAADDAAGAQVAAAQEQCAGATRCGLIADGSVPATSPPAPLLRRGEPRRCGS